MKNRQASRASQGPSRNSFISSGDMPPSLLPRQLLTSDLLEYFEVFPLLPIRHVLQEAIDLALLECEKIVDEG